jgi:hypothetical protein
VLLGYDGGIWNWKSKKHPSQEAHWQQAIQLGMRIYIFSSFFFNLASRKDATTKKGAVGVKVPENGSTIRNIKKVDATLLCHDNPMLLLCQTTGTSSSSKKSR